jgi:hypothetical protein
VLVQASTEQLRKLLFDDVAQPLGGVVREQPGDAADGVIDDALVVDLWFHGRHVARPWARRLEVEEPRDDYALGLLLALCRHWCAISCGGPKLDPYRWDATATRIMLNCP